MSSGETVTNPAVITAPPITPAPEPSTIPTEWSSDHLTAEYATGDVSSRIARSEGVLQTPICADPGTFGSNNAPNCGIVQMHAPCAVRVVTYEARRANAKPKIPQPVSSSQNEVLNSFVLTTLNPIMDGNNRIHRVGVRVEWLLRQAPDSTSGLAATSGPYDSASPTVYDYNAGDFDSGMVSPQSGGAATTELPISQ